MRLRHEWRSCAESEVDLASIGPLRLHLYQALMEHEPSIASVLVEVVAEPSTQENPGSSTFITGWPIRYYLPAAPKQIAGLHHVKIWFLWSPVLSPVLIAEQRQ